MNKKLTVAVVGATGMVGRTFLKVLEEKKLPVDTYYLFASAKSAGSKVQFMGKEYVIEELTETSFDRGIDIALFSAGGSTSEKFAPIAASKGCVVIDNSSAWRMNDEVPLVVPEGKVFLGWVTIEKDAEGRTVYNLVFEPDETGKVLLPEGNVLTPMTLYAYFEDADSVPTIETVPAETPAETVPETTAAPVPETTAAETAPAETTEGA